VPRVANSSPSATAGLPGVSIQGVYAALIADARAEVERGDCRAVLIEDPTESERARHDPRSPIVAGALRRLAALECGEPVRTTRGQLAGLSVPMFGRNVRYFVVTPDDRVRRAVADDEMGRRYP
jgi:hypothetical protein